MALKYTRKEWVHDLRCQTFLVTQSGRSLPRLSGSNKSWLLDCCTRRTHFFSLFFVFSFAQNNMETVAASFCMDVFVQTWPLAMHGQRHPSHQSLGFSDGNQRSESHLCGGKYHQKGRILLGVLRLECGGPQADPGPSEALWWAEGLLAETSGGYFVPPRSEVEQQSPQSRNSTVPQIEQAATCEKWAWECERGFEHVKRDWTDDNIRLFSGVLKKNFIFFESTAAELQATRQANGFWDLLKWSVGLGSALRSTVHPKLTVRYEVDGYESFWACNDGTGSQRQGLNGCATLVRKELLVEAASNAPLDDAELDGEGRCLLTDHGNFVIFNVYVPNSQGGPRLPFKMRPGSCYQTLGMAFPKVNRSSFWATGWQVIMDCYSCTTDLSNCNITSHFDFAHQLTGQVIFGLVTSPTWSVTAGGWELCEMPCEEKGRRAKQFYWQVGTEKNRPFWKACGW